MLNNKNIILFIITILWGYSLSAQNDKSLRISWGYYNSKTNEVNTLYERFNGYGDYLNLYSALKLEESALNLELELPCKIDNISFLIGSMLMAGEISGHKADFSNSHNNEGDFIYTYYANSSINGGGIYGGIETNVGHKSIGITAKFGIGIFSFKNYTVFWDNRVNPIIEFEDYKYSGGLGGIASIGAYAKIWRISINPNFQAVYSGGGNASFLFWGFNLPVGFYF